MMKLWYQEKVMKVQTNSYKLATSMKNNLFNVKAMLLLSLFALLLSAPLMAADLEEINFSSMPGGQVEVSFKLSGSFSEPGSFTVDEPARIALDFADTKNKLSWRSRRIGMGNIKSVSAIEAGNRTRIVINLVKQTSYKTRISGDLVILTLGATSADTQSQVSQSAPSNFPVSNVKSINNIDFRRGDNGEGRIVVTFSQSSIVADIREEAGKVIVEYLDTELPGELQQSLDVVDFATPVKSIDTFADNNNVRMIITPTGDYEHLAYQSDNTLTIDIKPLTQAQKAQIKKTQFEGEKLSLNFQDIEVRSVLQLLADFTGLNVVVSDTVQGNITLRLKNTPWDQALDIIMKTKGLALRKSGNVLLVAPSEEIAQREKLELEALEQLQKLSPLRSELVQINYAKASALAEILKSDESTLLSERGNVTIDERTNTLLIRDTVDRLTEIRKLIASLDIPIRQVLIEARIVVASDDFNRELGTRLGAISSRAAGSGNLAAGVSTTGLNSTGVTTNVSNSSAGTTGPSLFNVNLPATNTATPAGLALGFLVDNTLLDLELSALQLEGKGELVSNPRVITANQKEAFIEQGTEIPYSEGTSSGATSVSFKKAVLSLTVTPQITPDDRVILDLNVTKDTVIPAGDALNSNIPAIDTKEVRTQVLVDNGETVVLGGIFEEEKLTEQRKVPLLGDIPFLGWLFRSTTTVKKKKELLIFVTPKILKERLKIE